MQFLIELTQPGLLFGFLLSLLVQLSSQIVILLIHRIFLVVLLRQLLRVLTYLPLLMSNLSSHILDFFLDSVDLFSHFVLKVVFLSHEEGERKG